MKMSVLQILWNRIVAWGERWFKRNSEVVKRELAEPEQVAGRERFVSLVFNQPGLGFQSIILKGEGERGVLIVKSRPPDKSVLHAVPSVDVPQEAVFSDERT